MSRYIRPDGSHQVTPGDLNRKTIRRLRRAARYRPNPSPSTGPPDPSPPEPRSEEKPMPDQPEAHDAR